MSHRGKRAGKRGNEFNRSVKIAAQSMTDIGSTSDVVANGKGGKNAYTPAGNIHYDNSVEDELYREAGLVPRKSLSLKQHLAMFPAAEFRTAPAKRLDTSSPETIAARKMIPFKTTHVVWKSDKTLLRTNKVDSQPEGFHRVTSRSKRNEWIPEPLAPTGPLHWENPNKVGSDPILKDLKIEPLKTK